MIGGTLEVYWDVPGRQKFDYNWGPGCINWLCNDFRSRLRSRQDTTMV
jgi:hypothetical protein